MRFLEEAMQQLDARRGATHTITDWREAGERLEISPADLTDADVVVLGYFGGAESHKRAIAARQAGLASRPVRPKSVAEQWRRDYQERRRLAAEAKAAAEGTTKAAAATPRTGAARYITRPDLHTTIEAFIDALMPVLVKTVKPLQKKLDAVVYENATLNARIAELESAPRGLAYKGVWQRAAEYKRHDAVTWGGSVWCCVVDLARSQPDTDVRSWQLAVKRGTDGKDADSR